MLARQMEVYAGFLEHTDHHVGRLIDALDDLGGPRRHDRLLHHRRQRRLRRGHHERRLQRDGQLQRHGRARDPRVHAQQDGRVRLAELLQPLLGRLGLGDEHPVPVDQAGRLALGRHPQRHHRALARTGSSEPGGLRSQFTHVIDLAPTILEAAGLPEPTMVNGVQQSPMEGTSMLYSFNEPDAPERHDLQYFEMFGNRGIYHKGWSAVTKHRTPWVMVGGALPAFDDDVWELYDGTSDYSQARNLAAEQPRDAGQAAAALADRGHQVQRAADRRPQRGTARARTSPDGRP